MTHVCFSFDVKASRAKFDRDGGDELLPIILKIRLATAAMAGWSAAMSPVPLPADAIAVVVDGEAAGPTAVSFYDENEHQSGTLAIWHDGSTDADTAVQVKKLFRCRSTHREHMIAKKTLAMLADVSQHFDGRTIEYVSAYRVGANEGPQSPHRDARAVDFRIRGVQLREIRDYLWRSYTEVGVGWYPSEQFIHIDTRPGLHDTAWTFTNGDNHYHPYWAELARQPAPPTRPDRGPKS
jgi:uncharacterized protein YcbK (DUF882 family)